MSVARKIRDPFEENVTTHELAREQRMCGVIALAIYANKLQGMLFKSI